MPYGAENLGPITAPQVNQDFIVGSILYPTIASAVTAAAALSTGARVVIPYGATPTDTIGTQSGTAAILIADRRSGLELSYQWNGSAYVVQYPSSLTTTGTLTAAGATFSAPVVLPSGTPTGQQAVSASYLSSQLSASGMFPTATAAGQFLVSTGASNSYAARVLQSSDIPNNAANTTGTASNVTGIIAIANGGTNATSATQALLNLGALPTAGGSMTGPLVLSGNPVSASQAANKGYIDSQVANYLPLAGGTLSGTLNLTGAIPLTINGSALIGTPATPSSATPNFNGANGIVFVYTLAQAVTSSTFSNLLAGPVYMLEIIQAASGSGPFSFVYPTAFINSPAPVSQQAGQKTVVSFQVTTGGQCIVLTTVYI